jgi:hypothetical protein
LANLKLEDKPSLNGMAVNNKTQTVEKGWISNFESGGRELVNVKRWQERKKKKKHIERERPNNLQR